MIENEAIKQMKYRIETATQIVGKGEDGKAYEDMEMGIKALEMQDELKKCINGCTIDTNKVLDVLEKYLMN